VGVAIDSPTCRLIALYGVQIKYADGDREWVNLQECVLRFQFLPLPSLTANHHRLNTILLKEDGAILYKAGPSAKKVWLPPAMVSSRCVITT
jgi:hypothetical protein